MSPGEMITCMKQQLTNRFLSVTGIQTLGFGRRRYDRLFLATAGLLVIRNFHYLLLK